MHVMDMPLLVTVTISKGIMMKRFKWTANLSFWNHHQYKAVTSAGCLITVAPTKAAINQNVYGKTGCSVKDWRWGWPHMLRLHVGSCRCHNVDISTGWLPLERWGHHIALRQWSCLYRCIGIGGTSFPFFFAYFFSSSTFFCSFKYRKCFHSLPYSYKMRALCKWAFSVCSIKLSSCGLCIIIWPCLVKDIWSISCFPSLSNQTLQGVLYEVFTWISYRTIPFILPSQCYGAIVWLMCKYDLPYSTLV